MTALILSILPTLDEKREITSAAVWMIRSTDKVSADLDGVSAALDGVSAVVEGGDFPDMRDGDTITFVQHQKSLLRFDSFKYTDFLTPSMPLSCFYPQDSQTALPSGTDILLNPCVSTTYTVRHLPKPPSRDAVILTVKWSSNSTKGNEDNGSISGKLRGHVGGPPEGSLKRPEERG